MGCKGKRGEGLREEEGGEAMLPKKVQEEMVEEFRRKVGEFCGEMKEATFSGTRVGRAVRGLEELSREAILAGMKRWIEEQDETADLVERGGRRYRFKQTSPKKFLTPLGEMEVRRRLYQADEGGEAWVPLDEKWEMAGAYAMPEVQESVLFLSGQMPPREVSEVLARVGRIFFRPRERTR